MKLIYPNKKYLQSYIEAGKEYEQNNITSFAFDYKNENVFKKFDNMRKGINLKPGRVPATTYWLIDKGEFIGELTLRHHLNESLLRYAGNIGYGIRCSKWRMGYGTKILELGLIKARKMGLDKVLITCDDDNLGSSGVIENNGGVLENIIENIIDGKKIHTKRYWITLQELKWNKIIDLYQALKI